MRKLHIGTCPALFTVANVCGRAEVEGDFVWDPLEILPRHKLT
jgi:hypothetical protein